MNLYVTPMEARGEARKRGWRSGLALVTIMRKLGWEGHAFLLHGDDRVSHYWTTPDQVPHVVTFKAGSDDARWHWRQARENREKASIGA